MQNALTIVLHIAHEYVFRWAIKGKGQLKINSVGRSDVHRLDIWHQIGQLQLFNVTMLEWKIAKKNQSLQQNYKLKWIHCKINMLSTMISYNCVAKKFHNIRLKIIEIRQIFQHSIDTPW